jgi:hypothetical protein
VPHPGPCTESGSTEYSDPTGAKAEEHLTTAATMYREMGMTFWLEKAEATMGPPQ